MKDDPSTPTGSGQEMSPNQFERAKPTTVRRDQAEAAIERLRKEGGVFVNAVRATRMAMAITDPTLPGNPIVFANESFLKMSGYRMDEVLGQQPHFMNGPDTDPKDVARFIEAVQTDQDDLVETVQYRKNGSRFVATVLLSAYKDDDGHTLNHFMSWLDVTRRVEAEDEVSELRRTQAALRASEGKYRGLLDSIDEGFCIIEVLFDDAGRPTDYVFLETNSAFERQTGIGHAAGRRMRQIAPEHEQHWFDIYGRIALTGEPERFEHAAEALGRFYDVYAFRVGPPDENQVAILFNEISERKHAEKGAREREERQAFLLRLSDTLRPINEAREIQATTARMVGEQLGADRAMYAEVEGDAGAETGTICGQYVRPGSEGEATAPFPEHFTYGQFGQHTMAARYRGEPLIVADVQTDPAYSAEERAAWAQFGVRAAIVATLSKGRRLVAEFGVHSTTARKWTEAEIALVKEVAERTWAAAERARAETALRESEEKYRVLFDTIDSGYALTDNVRDEEGRVVDLFGVDFNRSFTQHSGLPPFEGRRASEVITVEPEWLRQFEEVTRSGVPARFENYIAERDRWVSTHYSLVGRLGSDRVAVVFHDITDRKQAEAALRESEERHAYVLRLSDALRPLTDAVEIVGTATRLLGEECRASRAYYAEWPPGTDYVEIRSDYAAPGLPSLVGRYPIDFFRSTDERFREGQTWVIQDAADGTIPPEERDYCLAHGVAAWVDVPLLKDGKLQAALFLVQDAPRCWTATEIALAEETAERTWAAIERARAEAALRASEEKYRSLFESMDEAYAVVEVLQDDAGKWADFRFLDANPAFLEHTSMPYPVGKTATELLGTPNPRWTELYGQALDTGRAIRVEEEEPTLGRTFDLNMFSLDREQNRVAVLFNNITERKASEQALKDSESHAQVLLAELQHRVRNTLAVVRSIARRTAQLTESSADFMSHFEGRLNAFSRVQAVVTRSATGRVELKSLIDDELLALAMREGEHLRIEGPKICLTPRAAESLSLAIHELATNAVKYGALSVPNGRIQVTWDCFHGDKGQTLELEWRELGLETPPVSQREGFGHELLLRSLPYDLGAATDIAFEDEGLRFTMTLPLGPEVGTTEPSTSAK